MTDMERFNYLIIGNSAGGIGAAEAIRETDAAGTIAIVTEEPYPAYSRPMISKNLAEGCPVERMLFRPADFYEKHGIRTMLGRKVSSIDTAGHTVTLENGEMLGWDKLLLATGGMPIIPQMEGLGLRGVFPFIALEDAKAVDGYIRERPDRQMKAVVIGGGLIGVSASEALIARGVEVTVIEMKDRVLNTILDETCSAMEAEKLTAAGVHIITEHTTSQINGNLAGEVSGVTLDDGRALFCDMVIMAIGVRPRIERAPAAGVNTHRGIIGARHMETSAAGVYACGDAAEAYDFIYGENRLSPIWPNAYLGGRAAGFNMAGKATEYPGGTTMNSMKYFGVNIVSAGMVVPPDAGYEVLSSAHGDVYKKVVLKNGLIQGLVFAGEIEKSGIVYNLMKNRVDVTSFKTALVGDDFGLVSLPETYWREKITMPDSIAASGGSHIEPREGVPAGE
jgi:NAD(P)H-nitrite reductase large subunit